MVYSTSVCLPSFLIPDLTYNLLTTIPDRRHQGGTWFAQLRYLITYVASNGTPHYCALVRYLVEVTEEHKDAARQRFRMPWLKWSCVVGPRGQETPVIEWIPLESIQGPAYMQPDPIRPERFFYNKHICQSC